MSADIPDQISLSILAAAAAIQQEGKLVGRNSILRYMERYNQPVSEYRIRKILQQLEKNNYLEKEAGYGMKVTDQGKIVLMNQK